MAFTHRKTIIFPPLVSGVRYVVMRPNSEANDYLLHRIILLAIKPIDEKNRSAVFSFSLVELAQILHWPKISADNCQMQVSELVERFMARKLYIIGEEEQQCVNFFEKISFNQETIELVLGCEIIRFLLWQQDYWGLANLAKIDFAPAHAFSSVYTEIIYNKIINNPSGSFELEIDSFRELVWAIAPSYADIRNLKQKVLTPIINDINTHSAYLLNVTQRSCGRRVTHLLFNYKTKASC